MKRYLSRLLLVWFHEADKLAEVGYIRNTMSRCHISLTMEDKGRTEKHGIPSIFV